MDREKFLKKLAILSVIAVILLLVANCLVLFFCISADKSILYLYPTEETAVKVLALQNITLMKYL